MGDSESTQVVEDTNQAVDHQQAQMSVVNRGTPESKARLRHKPGLSYGKAMRRGIACACKVDPRGTHEEQSLDIRK